MHLLLFLVFLPALAQASSYTMGVYADVVADSEFFYWTFPWIIDQLSGNIEPYYYLLGSGRYAVPQMCVLDQLRGNVFLQVEYLRCEANWLPSETCLCKSGVDSELYKQCVLQGGDKAIAAAVEYQKLNLTATPVIKMWTEPLHSLLPEEYLERICAAFLDEEKPPGCLNFDPNNPSGYLDRSIAVHFECKNTVNP